MKLLRPIAVLLAVASTFLTAMPSSARTVLRNICRVKGQEENVLRGMGLVIGLNGTGEAADVPTMRALARAMDIMGQPIPEMPLGTATGLKELEKGKNVALVMVTARVPATGARRGDQLDCYVSGITGKSLAGGRLAFAALRGPNTRDETIYALCEGAVHLENSAAPLNGVVTGGCQMEEDVITRFQQDGRITLILDEHHANWLTATEITDAIRGRYSREGDDIVQATSASNIVVKIPPFIRDDPVAFVAELLDTEVYSPEPEARVVINQKTGSIVISGDVTIGDVVVSHKNIVIEAGQAAEFTSIDPEQTEDAKLQSLVTALNSIKAPHSDVVEIIKEIARTGKLHGRLIVE
jgi:flagellar P-ring protein precursor FlgI